MSSIVVTDQSLSNKKQDKSTSVSEHWMPYQQIYIRQQVEHILQLIDDLVVDGEFACCHPLQVRANIQQLWVQAL